MHAQTFGVDTIQKQPCVRCIHAAVPTARASSAPPTATIRIAHFSIADSLHQLRHKCRTQNAECRTNTKTGNIAQSFFALHSALITLHFFTPPG